jgi:hypothetical protein
MKLTRRCDETFDGIYGTMYHTFAGMNSARRVRIRSRHVMRPITS